MTEECQNFEQALENSENFQQLLERVSMLEKLLGQTRSCATCCSDPYCDGSYPYGPCQGCSGAILKPNWSPNYGTL